MNNYEKELKEMTFDKFLMLCTDAFTRDCESCPCVANCDPQYIKATYGGKALRIKMRDFCSHNIRDWLDSEVENEGEVK